MNLKEINDKYETILHSNLSQDKKDKAFADLMTTMEQTFNIPMLRKSEYEADNRKIIAMYRKISMSRSI